MYFGNKFDKEFLYLCNKQRRGLSGTFDLNDSMWWEFRKHSYKDQPTYVQAIPLVLANKLSSSNSKDKNIEDKMLLCQNKTGTKLKCEWDYDKTLDGDIDEFICDFGITTITGDLVGKK